MKYTVLAWLMVALLGLNSSPSSAESARVKGTRVTMDTPEGFKPAPNFFGFANEAASSSVMITEMPIPFEAATAGFTKEKMEPKGMKLISKEDIKVGDYPGYILEVRQPAFGTEFAKWINVFGDKNNTVLVTATYPASDPDSLSKKLKDTVLSARFDAQAKLSDPMADLPFTVSGTTTLKIAGRVQNTLLLTPTGKMTPSPQDKDKSVFVVGQALSDLEIGDKTEFARTRLQKTDMLMDIIVLSEKDVTVSGMPAREITATAADKDGEKLFILQTIAYGRGSYFIMQGITDVSSRTRMEYEFRNVINSLKLKSAET